jgi:undecaprenyl-phosphate galactose phosphotransferase/putative colanic acid biosynthesis UDP-glucose lipid carrier transferase
MDLLLILACSAGMAVAYHRIVLHGAPKLEAYLAVGAISFLNFAAIEFTRGGYSVAALRHFPRQVRAAGLAWIVVISALLAFFFVAKLGATFSRGSVALFAVVGLPIILAWRWVLSTSLPRLTASGVITGQRLLIIADEKELAWMSDGRSSQLGEYTVTQVFTYRSVTAWRAVGRLVDEAIVRARVDEVDAVAVLADWSNDRLIDGMAVRLRALPLPVLLLPDHRTARRFSKSTPGRQPPAALLQRAPLTPGERAAKRAVDIAGAAAGLLLCAPLFLLVAFLIKLDSHGPVFFRQKRIGFDGRPFRIVKFRSMNVLEDSGEIRQATQNDRRVTRIGRWLRRSSVDELPQLWNVLCGEMSIVGPRPHAVAHDEQYQRAIASYAFRQHVKPGLTGWAQINGLRGETSTVDLMRRRVEHDLHYINHWSPLLDFIIIARTAMLVVRDRAAY